jgi:hypothetical protein
MVTCWLKPDARRVRVSDGDSCGKVLELRMASSGAGDARMNAVGPSSRSQVHVPGQLPRRYSAWRVRAGSIVVARRAGTSVATAAIATSTAAAATNVGTSVALVS